MRNGIIIKGCIILVGLGLLIAKTITLLPYKLLKDQNDSTELSISPDPLLDVGNYALPATDHLRLKTLPFPSKIWQSWKDDSENPTDRTVGFPQQWRTMNPEFRYERITDSNSESYVRDQFVSNPDIASLFTEISDPILRADLLRYLILFKEGGLWTDIDTYPKQPISEWVAPEHINSTNFVVGVENDHGDDFIWPGVPYSVQLAQFTVLAKPGHVVMAKLIERVCNKLRGLLDKARSEDHMSETEVENHSSMRGHAGLDLNLHFDEVMNTTGPFQFTTILMEYFSEQTGEDYGRQLKDLKEPKLIGDVLLLPLDSFGWMPQAHTVDEDDPLVKSVHLFIGSWRNSHPA